MSSERRDLESDPGPVGALLATLLALIVLLLI